MKLLSLSWKMLRYRVALMLLLFLFLGIAWHGKLSHFYPQELLAILALAASYISATTSNDLIDEEVDKINHPSSPGRPLVNKEATRSDLKKIFFISSAVALALAASIGFSALFIIFISLVINISYSVPPLKLSYRTFAAPFLLAVAYVCIPYTLGVVAVGDRLSVRDTSLLIALYFIFVGRISLKDFRDRAGDNKFGKPTLLLRYGKQATCYFSGSMILLGTIIFLWTLRAWGPLLLYIPLFVSTIGAMLYRLYKSEDLEQEQISIGVGAKMGNGMLILTLGLFALSGQVDISAKVTLILGLSLLYFINFIRFLQNPSLASLGYRG